ncbi:MAG: hypothetical protein ACLFTK_17515 [Anaerolineales bacterium]
MQPDRIFRQNALERMQSPERLDTLMHVTQPLGWLSLATIAVIFAGLITWSVVARIPTTVQAEGALQTEDGTLQAVLYMPAADAQQIEPGMDVLLSPVNASPQDYGYLQGQVLSVSTTPARGSLPRAVVPDGAAFEVLVSLETDDDTPTGYAWSVGQGPQARLLPDLSLTGQIILAREAPLSRILPLARTR